MPRIFSNVFGFSSTLSGFVRQNPYQNTPLITALRSIRDIDEVFIFSYYHVFTCLCYFFLIYLYIGF